MIIRSLLLTFFIILKLSIQVDGQQGFIEDSIVVKNDLDDIALSATLTLPEGNGPYRLAILINGSGPQDRNSTIMGLQPFKVLSDYLVGKGIATLRWDERGVGKSTGRFLNATSADLSRDVRAMIAYGYSDDRIDSDHIGLIGHSEGGMIAAMVAADNDSIAFVVSMAGPGLKISDLMTQQNVGVLSSMGMSSEGLEIVSNRLPDIYSLFNLEVPFEEKKLELLGTITSFYHSLPEADQKILSPSAEIYHINLAVAINQPWFAYFLRYDPALDWKQVSCPVLALNGSKDIQVSSGPNLRGIGQALLEGGNYNFTLQEIPNMNHLFQNCETCDINEYTTIKEVMAHQALKYIDQFIRNLP